MLFKHKSLRLWRRFFFLSFSIVFNCLILHCFSLKPKMEIAQMMFEKNLKRKKKINIRTMFAHLYSSSSVNWFEKLFQIKYFIAPFKNEIQWKWFSGYSVWGRPIVLFTSFVTHVFSLPRESTVLSICFFDISFSFSFPFLFRFGCHVEYWLLNKVTRARLTTFGNWLVYTLLFLFSQSSGRNWVGVHSMFRIWNWFFFVILRFVFHWLQLSLEMGNGSFFA